MSTRTAFTVVSGALVVGLIGLTLLPGQHTPKAAKADRKPVAVASLASPSPDLLKRLDAEVAPPPPKTIEPTREPLPGPAQRASVQDASLTTGVSMAAPSVAADPSLHSETVGSSAVNLRAGPSSNAQQIAVLQPGEPVQTGEISGGWVKVTRADGTSGWVYSSYLSGGKRASSGTQVADTSTGSLAATPPPAPKAARPRAVVHGASGDLEDRIARIASRLPGYARPSDSAQSVFTFTPGDEVRIAEVRGNWLRVETADGFTAWIRR